MFSKIIEGKKITLRSCQKDDIFCWQGWDIDPDVQRFMPEPKNTPASQKEGLQYLKECKNEEEAFYWSVIWKKNNKLVGILSLTEIDKHHGIGEIGIVIGEKEYWGKGVASEAIKLLLNFSSSELKLRRITAEYEEGNIAIKKILEKSGFKKEAVCKKSRIKNKKPINTIRYYILLP